MAIFNQDLDFTKLIQFTDGTIQVASFVQIRNALIQKFKDIYGNDIDISPASADGQYINSIALLINNTFQTIKKGFDSLDPAVATGGFLDTLCSYNNIFRIQASQSKAQLRIYNPTNNSIYASKLTFIDRSGHIWTWDNGGIQYEFESNTTTILNNVLCNDKGTITAEGTDPLEPDWANFMTIFNAQGNGTIYQCIEQNQLYVWQFVNAEPGNDDETDEALRSRRYQMLGNQSVTVLEGLKGSLLNIDGIKDVYIFNNMRDQDYTLNHSEDQPLADGTEVLAHSIYVAIRYKEGYDLKPELIGRVIYNKLTPGIATNATDDSVGSTEQLEIVRSEEALTDIIYWKKCGSIKPEFKLEFSINIANYNYPLSSGSIITTSHNPEAEIEKNIVNNLQKYIDNIKINEFLTIPNLLTILQQSDILMNGMSTFFASNGGFKNGADYDVPKYPANLSYFEYSDFKFSYSADGKTGTLIIK